MSNINNSLIYTAPSISQRAAIQALAIRQTIREKYVLAYRDRIFYAADRMEQIPYLSLVRPKGTFYLFPGIEKTGLSAEDFCQALWNGHTFWSTRHAVRQHRRRTFPHCVYGGAGPPEGSL